MAYRFTTAKLVTKGAKNDGSKNALNGSGYGPVGRVVASNSRVGGSNPVIANFYQNIYSLSTVLKRRKWRKRRWE